MQLFAGNAAQKNAGDADLIKDSSLKTFAQDVIHASMQTPVLVDFWAPWCGPCKQLTPILEKVVRGAKGKVRLVKVNVDENPEIAQQLRIKTLPTVYAFLGGQPVTGFTGAQPESQVKLLVEQLLGETVGADLADAIQRAKAAAEQGDHQTALQLFGALAQEDPENPEAFAGVARSLMALGQEEQAMQVLASVPAKLRDHAEIASVRSALELAAEGRKARGKLAEYEKRLAADPDDHQARIDLAVALNAAGERAQAADALLEAIRRDRAWNDEAARKQLVKFFEAWGFGDPASVAGRRKLSSLLFR
jgi:putative thioredoxin